jgi:hypothetical protein
MRMMRRRATDLALKKQIKMCLVLYLLCYYFHQICYFDRGEGNCQKIPYIKWIDPVQSINQFKENLGICNHCPELKTDTQNSASTFILHPEALGLKLT